MYSNKIKEIVKMAPYDDDRKNASYFLDMKLYYH